MIFNQKEYNIKCEWGLKGMEQLAVVSDVIIIVDILSFSTCVDIAVSNGAEVYPYRYKDNTAVEYAKNINAVIADFNRSKDVLSLSPSSLVGIETGTKLV